MRPLAKMAALRAAYYRPIRAAVRQSWGGGVPDVGGRAAQMRLSLSGPEARLRIACIRLLGRVVAVAPAFVRTAVDLEACWLDQAVADLEWVRERAAILPLLPEPSGHLAVWLDFMRAAPGRWRRAVAAAERTLSPTLSSTSATWLRPRQLPERSSCRLSGLVCYECGFAGCSIRTFQTHMRKAHGVRAAVAPAAHGTSCLRCMRIYHTRQRLLQHLRQCAGCAGATAANVQPADGPDLEADMAAERLRLAALRRASTREPAPPAFRLQGPLTRWAAAACRHA